MAQTIQFEGQAHQFPDDFSDADIKKALSSIRAPRTFWDSVGDTGKALWERTGQPIADASQFFSSDPAAHQKAVETIHGMARGVRDIPLTMQRELAETGRALIHGKPGEAAYHAAGAVPVVGPQAQEAADDFANGDYAKGFGHGAAVLAPFVAPEVLAELKQGGAKAAAGVKAAGRKIVDVATTPGNLNIGAGVAQMAGGAATFVHEPVAGTMLIGSGLKRAVKGVAERKAALAARAEEAAATARTEATSRAAAEQRANPKTPAWKQEQPPAVSEAPAQTESALAELPSGRQPGGIANMEPIAPAAEAGEEAAPGPDPAFLDQIAQGQAGKPFKKLDARGQSTVLALAERIQGAENKPQLTGPLADPRNPASRLPSASEAQQIAEDEARQYVDSIAKQAAPPAPQTAPAAKPAPGPELVPPKPKPAPEAPPKPAKPEVLTIPSKADEFPPEVYEASARAEKAGKLARILHDHGIAYEDAKGMSSDEWNMAAAGARVKIPSKVTQSHALFELRKLETSAPIAKELRDQMAAQADEAVKHYTDNGLQPAPGSTATPEEIRAGAELAVKRLNEKGKRTRKK